MSFVKSKNGSLRLDVEWKLGSIVGNEIILEEIRRFFEATCPSGDRLVDVGAGSVPFDVAYGGKFRSVVTFDVASSPFVMHRWTLRASVEDIPLKDKVADVVLCTEVLEHTRNPKQAVMEMSRICRAGGYLFATTPFLLGIHDAPHDYYRFTEYGLAELLSESGFKIVRLRVRGEIAGVILSLFVAVQIKFWNYVGKLFPGRSLTSLFNPFIWLFVYIPQVLYVLVEKKMAESGGSISRKWLQKFSHYNLGYVLVAKKKGE